MNTIQKLENDARVVVRGAGIPDPDGRCVVYWMRRSIRAEENPSLDIAIQAANVLDKPVLVFFAMVPVANANLRHYMFLIEALAEIPDALRKKNVGFVLRRYPSHSVAKFCSEVGAALLITDENPLRGPEHRLQTGVGQLRIPVWSVDSDVVVPSKLIPGKQYAARIIRPKLMRLRDKFLIPSRSIAAKVPWKHNVKSLPCDLSALDGMKINHSVQPAPAIRGGTREAKRLLREFVMKKLASYPERRNHPEDDGTSRLSPYLHFGNISPVTIAREVLKADAPNQAKEAVRDQ